MQIRSSEFEDGAKLPERFAADDANMSPPFRWSKIPPGTKSFALLCEDPDAGDNPFFHWAIYNIPAEADSLPENASLTFANSEDIFQGLSDAGIVGYFGPHPPANETHRYRFRLFALGEKTNLPAGMPDRDVLEKIKSNTIAEADVTAKYGS